MDEIVFTTSSLIDLLSQIDELKDLDVGILEEPNGTLQLNVGNSSYSIDTTYAEEVEAPAEVVDEIGDVNDEAYTTLSDTTDVSIVGVGEEAVESGILKELAKTLAIGGMVRLSANILKK